MSGRGRSLARAALLGALALLALPALALAHPLGNFTINHYSRLEPAGDRLRVFYVLDLAEIPTFQEQSDIDRDGDGVLSDAERGDYATRKAEELRQGLSLRLNGAPAELRLVSRALSFPAGQGGLPTLRLEALYETTPVAGREVQVEFRDGNYPGRIGWKEVVVRGGGGTLLDSDAPATDASDELRQYPVDMLSSPSDRTSARFRYQPGAVGGGIGALAALAPSTIARPSDAYAALVSAQALTLPVVLLSLLAAAFWGALHALTPGHGKSIVAAYLVGSRGTARHAAFLGLTVTITHTLGVYALGLLTLVAARYVLPERLYPWLGLLSGLIVVGMGATLLRRRLAAALRRRPPPRAAAPAPFGGLVLASVGAAGEVAAHALPRPAALTATATAPLAAGAARGHAHAREQGGDSHGDAHGQLHELSHRDGHGYGGGRDHGHDRGQGHAHNHEHAHAHAHGDAHDHDHDHGPHGHSHLPPGADGGPVTWRSLLALGVSGGLLPCPSALVVMLGSIALGRVAFGLALVVAFSVGLAGVLIGLGLLLVYAGRVFARVPARGALFAYVPAASAAVILVLGLAITVQSLLQTGLLGA